MTDTDAVRILSRLQDTYSENTSIVEALSMAIKLIVERWKKT